MTLSRSFLPLAGALVALLAGTAATSAAPAFATTDLNVRAGPGTGHAVLGVLRPGERVEVEYCRGTWCYIERSGPDGFVNAAYLEAAYDGDDDDDEYWEDDDDAFFLERPRHYRDWPRSRARVCIGGGSGSLCISD